MAENVVLTKEMFQKLLDGQSKISEDIRQNLSKQNEYERNAEVTKGIIYTVSGKLSEVYTSQADIIDANSEDIMDLRETVRGNQGLIKENQNQNQEIMVILRKVNERLDNLERQQLELSMEVKAKSVVISGLSEQHGENTLITAFNFLNSIDGNLLQDDIDICYRIGQQQDIPGNLPGNAAGTAAQRNAPRSLIVIFKTIAKKRDIMSLKKNLKNSEQHNMIYVNEDLPVDYVLNVCCEKREGY